MIKDLYKFHFIAFLLIPFSLSGRSDSTDIHFKWYKNHLSLTAAYINGFVAPTNIFVQGTNHNSVLIDDFQAVDFKLSSQTLGEHLNEKFFNYPNFGVGLKVLNFDNVNEIGLPIALYGFMNLPLLRARRLTLITELSFGLSFNWKAFNPITNEYNIAFGLGQAFMSDAGLSLNYELTNHVDLVGGFNFTHFSNGAIKQPNRGINSYAPKIGVKYNFYERPKFEKYIAPKYKPHGEWVLSAFTGIKNIVFDSVNIDIIERYEGAFFPVFGVSALYNWQVSKMSKFGIGTTFNFNESINAQVAIENNELVDVDGPFADKLQISIYPSYELCIDRVSVLLQPAFYIYRKNFKNQSPVFHQRISINYQITDNIFAGITLRDYSMHADFVEWTLGYRFDK